MLEASRQNPGIAQIMYNALEDETTPSRLKGNGPEERPRTAECHSATYRRRAGYGGSRKRQP